MTLCDDLAPALAALQDRHAWRCNPLPDGRRVLIHTGRNRADSEPVTLLAAFFDADTVLISDGGETLNRLGDVGFDRDDPLFEAIWQEALRTYRLSEVDGRVFLQAPLTRAPHAMNRLADALVALDGLRIVTLPQQDKRRTLADQVEDYLYRILPPSVHVTRRPQVKLRSGLVLRPALALDVPQRPRVLIQPGSTSAKTQSFDHAHTTFSLIAEGDVPKASRLVVLGGSPSTWDLTRLRYLAEVAYVGFLTHGEGLRGFLQGRIPNDPLMTPPGLDVPMLTAER